MKFGFAKEDITPKCGVSLSGYFEPRPNTGFHDSICVKAALFSCGDSAPCGLVSFDLLGVPSSVVRFIKEQMKEAGIDYSGNLLFSATHTHTAPYISMDWNETHANEEYIRSLAVKTVSAVKRAFDNLAEAEMYVGKTECHTLAFNRRFWMKDGTVLTNPGKLNPDIVKSEGIIDPAIPFFVIRQNGMDRLIVANISNHTDTIGDDLVSADWPGRMERAIQDHYGYDIPVMTIIGCQGNINHFNVENNVDQTNYCEACRIGKGYAAAIISMLYAVQKKEISSVHVDSEEFEARVVQITDEQYNEAKKIVEELKDVVPTSAKDLTSEGIAAGNLYVKKVFAKRITDCRDNPLKEKRIETMSALKFGDQICIQSIPAEPFVELGFAIREKSPFPCTFIAGITQGYIGYTGLPECYKRGGGYETRPSNTAPAHDLSLDIIALGIKLVNK